MWTCRLSGERGVCIVGRCVQECVSVGRGEGSVWWEEGRVWGVKGGVFERESVCAIFQLRATVSTLSSVPPMSITLVGIKGPVSANVGRKVTCRVVGARPIPTVTFWLDGRPVKSDSERSTKKGNVTESELILTPTADDQGRFLSCRAETPGLLQGRLEDGVKLEVNCE